MMEFTFEASAWEMSLTALRPGAQLSAGRFLAMMETESTHKERFYAMRKALLDAGVEAMAAGAMRVLTGEEQALTYSGKPVWNGFEDEK